MSLLELQRDMHAWLTQEDAGAAMRLGHAAGLRVYQNNYRAQLVACLEDGFARTQDWIGADAFSHALVTHIGRMPPSSWTLDAYGRDFPETLALLFPDDPEVAELARIELALDEAFVAPDAVALVAADLAGIDWNRAVLRLTPTLDLVEVTSNAFAIWLAMAEDRDPPAAEILPEAGAVIVWRMAEIAQARPVDREEGRALLSIRSGLTFPGLCEEIIEARGEEAGIALAGHMVGQWLADGLIVGVDEAA